MLPLCSTTANYSSLSQVCLYGGCAHSSSYNKTFLVKCIMNDGGAWRLSNKLNLQEVSFKSQATTYLSSNYVESDKQSSSIRFANLLVEEASTSSDPVDLQTITTADAIPNNSASISDSLNIDDDSVTVLNANIEDLFGGINESLSSSVIKGETAITKSLETVTSSVESSFKGANEAVDSALSNLKSILSNTLTNFASNSKEASSKMGIIAVDLLRHAIVTIEDFLSQGATLVTNTYASTKGLLPPEVQSILTSSEERTISILRPVGTTFQQVNIVLEGVERSLGIDPNDPIVPCVIFLGTSATLWVSYWIVTYAGYAGDLSPKSTLELLNGSESAVLIDVRPEDFKERDGIPDLRRAARSRYASVALPEVDVYVKKILKSGKNLDDTLIAAVIRNLKIVQDRSHVIVMDDNGTRSKGIARSLRKLGIKKPYVLQGGFRSWVQEGLRIKELKPETTLTILNEEAEAILEDINPTPLKVLGFGVGFIAASYALLEWEKTLQLIAIFGLGQTIYRRIASYENSEDFNQDVRQLLAPVMLGGQAISWAAGKLEPNRNGLPTSPSSSDVQNRVLQAAAKHESQPSDSEESQDTSPDSAGPINQNVDLSEA